MEEKWKQQKFSEGIGAEKSRAERASSECGGREHLKMKEGQREHDVAQPHHALRERHSGAPRLLSVQLCWNYLHSRLNTLLDYCF